MDLHDIIIEELSRIKDEEVALCLSSGVDSASLLFGLLELNKSIHVYSFTREDIESTDFKTARDIAKSKNLLFTPIYLPTDVNTIINDLYTLAKEYKAVKKTDFECSFPFLHAYPLISEKYIVTGIPADGHFCLSKKGMIHYKNNIDEFRRIYFSNCNVGQIKQRSLMAQKYGKINIDPFYSPKIVERLNGYTWDELNKPYQKMPILNSFMEEFKEIGIKRHTNFQLGDSGISELFKKILTTDLNDKGYKSVVGVYNTIIKKVNKDAQI